MRTRVHGRTVAIAIAALLALALAGCDAIERESKRSEAAEQMQRGYLALEQERYEDARSAFGTAYGIYKSIRDTLPAAHALVGRGMAAAGLERHEEAIADLGSALKLHAVDGSADDPLRAQILSLIGDSQGQISRWSEAVAAFEQALEIEQRAHGGEDPRSVRLLIGLVWAWDARADYKKAQGYLDRATAITGKPGYDDVVLTSFVSYARVQVLSHVGRRQEALELAQRTLLKARERLAPDHNVISTGMNLLGYCYLEIGRAEEALAQFEGARGILVKRYGERSSEAATVTDSVGEAKRELGRFAEALALHEQALEVKRAAGAGDTDEVAWLVDNIGRAKLGLGRFDEAIADFDRAMGMVRTIHGPGHPDEARELAHKGRALCAKGRADAARAQLDQALEILGTHFGPDHPDAVEVTKQIETCSAAPATAAVQPAS